MLFVKLVGCMFFFICFYKQFYKIFGNNSKLAKNEQGMSFGAVRVEIVEKMKIMKHVIDFHISEKL